MLGNVPPFGWLIIAVLVLVLFGRGRIAGLMGEMGKGMSSFKRGVEEGKQQAEDEKIEAAKDITPDDSDKPAKTTSKSKKSS